MCQFGRGGAGASHASQVVLHGTQVCRARLAFQKHLAVWRVFQALLYELRRFVIVPSRLMIHLLHAEDTILSRQATALERAWTQAAGTLRSMSMREEPAAPAAGRRTIKRAARKLSGNLSRTCFRMLLARGKARQSSAAVATCSIVSHTVLPSTAQPLQQLARLSRPAGSGMFPSHTPASQLACSHQPLSFRTALVTLAFSGLSGRRVRTTKPPCCSTLGLYARCCVGSCGNGEQARPAEVAHALQRRAARGACAAAPPPQGLHSPSREPSAHAPALPPLQYGDCSDS